MVFINVVFIGEFFLVVIGLCSFVLLLGVFIRRVLFSKLFLVGLDCKLVLLCNGMVLMRFWSVFFLIFLLVLVNGKFFCSLVLFCIIFWGVFFLRILLCDVEVILIGVFCNLFLLVFLFGGGFKK